MNTTSKCGTSCAMSRSKRVALPEGPLRMPFKHAAIVDVERPEMSAVLFYACQQRRSGNTLTDANLETVSARSLE
jgi:hypothetical protein